MKFLILIVAGLRRRALRTTLTTLAIAVAFLLFGVMHGVISSFDSVADNMSDVRLRVLSRANMLETLPVSYRERIMAVDGVTRVAVITIFLGYYQNPTNQVIGVASNLEDAHTHMPEVKIPADQFEALQANRIGAMAGVQLVERFGWKIGDRIPLKSMIWMHSDTGQDWTFDLMAIANAGPDDDRAFGGELWFHYDYLEEGRATGKGRVNQFIVGIEDASQANRIAQEVDALFANSSDETLTVNEKQYLENTLRQVGNIEAFVYYILSAVLFTLLFMTGINMVQAIRERTTELGIMRAVGFRADSLGAMVIVESLIMSLVGALLGLAIAAMVFPTVFTAFNISGIQLGGQVWLQGVVIAAVLALAAAAWPAWRVSTLNVVDAIAGENRR